jgi:hypothetical protein
MKWFLVVFALSLCPVCHSPYQYRQQLAQQNQVFQGTEAAEWFNQWHLVQCAKCNNAFFVEPDTIVQYREEYKLIDTSGEIRKFYYKQDTVTVQNPRWAKKEAKK